MKRIIVGIGIVLISAGFGFLYIVSKGSGKILNQPTERAKEYMRTQKEKQDPLWRNIDVEKKSKPDSILISARPCFSITIPYQTDIVREDKKCSYYVQLSRSAGKIVVYMNDTSYSSLDDDPGVRLRRSDNEYQEKSIKTNGRTFIIFTRQDGQEERTGFTLIGKKLFVLNLLGPAGDSPEHSFITMLESLKIL